MPGVRFFTSLLLWITILLSTNACMVKHASVPPGTVPEVKTVSPAEQEYGHRLFRGLCKDYEHDTEDSRLKQMVTVFDELTQVAKANENPWQLHLFHDPKVDLRAVNGNYVFVWSGLLDLVESEDEMAAMLAQEIGHVLARHTEPVRFNIWSEVFFQVASISASFAIMTLSQGTVAVGGNWMRWAYVEAADLDPLDRKYSQEQEREATAIALAILARSNYSPQAMLEFWKRMGESGDLENKVKPLCRDLSPQDRTAMVTELLASEPSGQNGTANKQKESNHH